MGMQGHPGTLQCPGHTGSPEAAYKVPRGHR
ncbi:hypothetical protein E2C01_063256 [Portunus trituberculatus]|uniref:Uncharacterized protein n=1 Tax=Portunus trituberculatus TaxID=210409 RepID=A0A5B7HKB6_PORTR|nr:hypothetical protein [Portunus trituberculatus]